MSSKERELTRFFDEDGQPNNQDSAKADDATVVLTLKDGPNDTEWTETIYSCN